MTKNYIIAAVLSLLVIMGSSFLQLRFFPPVPPASLLDQELQSMQSDTQITQLDNLSIASSVVPAIEVVEQETKEETIVLETELLRVRFSNRGGDIISYELLDHLDKGVPVQMADNISQANRAFSLAFGDAATAITNDLFTIRRINENSVGFFRTFATKSSDGKDIEFTLIKQYTFKPHDYLFQLDIIVAGENDFSGLSFNNVAYTLRTPPQIGPYFDKKKDRYESRSFMSYTNDKRKKQALSDAQTKSYDSSFSWTGITGKYFAVLVIPPENSAVEKVLYSTQVEMNDYANAQSFLVRNPVRNAKNQDTYYIYMGPKNEFFLSKYNNSQDNEWNLSNLRLNESIDSTGVLSWLEAILKWIMEMFYKIIPNWGISIILLTILLKIAMYPLTKKSSVSTLKMQELQPRMQEIQTKYKGEPEKMNAEMAKLYQETGYNPLSGCLPLVIQFPLIFAMFNLFNNYFEFRGAMFIQGWIPDLSQGDSIFTFAQPLNLLFWQVSDIRVLPVIYVISQLLFGKFTQSSGSAQNNPSMKIMMYGMPLFFFFLFYDAPSGLIIYWTVSNILQLVQQVTINKIMHRKKMENQELSPIVHKKRKKK
ncbi:MAG: membrane protein insertase YidC [Treponemataceae bacterium]